MTNDIETSIENSGPDAEGTRKRTAYANRLPFVAAVGMRRAADGSIDIRGCGGVFYKLRGIYYVSRDMPALTWESTDEELIAAAVKILEQAESGK